MTGSVVALSDVGFCGSPSVVISSKLVAVELVVCSVLVLAVVESGGCWVVVSAGGVVVAANAVLY